MDTNSNGTIKTCPKCGATFSCSPTDCWCSALPPVMPMHNGAECYCPKCLGAIIEEKLAATS